MTGPAPSVHVVCPECGAPEWQRADLFVRAATRYWPGFAAVAIFIVLTLAFFVARQRSSIVAISANPLAPFVEEYSVPVSIYSQRPSGVTRDAASITITDPVNPVTGMQSWRRISITALGLWLTAALTVFLIPFPIHRRILYYRYDTRTAKGHCPVCNFPSPRATTHGDALLKIIEHRRTARQTADS